MNTTFDYIGYMNTLQHIHSGNVEIVCLARLWAGTLKIYTIVFDLTQKGAYYNLKELEY